MNIRYWTIAPICLAVLFLTQPLIKINSSKKPTPLAGASKYKINLDPSTCKVNIEKKLKIQSQYQEKIKEQAGLRQIKINSIANHNVGSFPNAGNPSRIRSFKMEVEIPLHPEIAGNRTNARGWDTGILFSGVSMEPYTAEFFVGRSGRMNREWNITTLSTGLDLGLDCNNAHVQPTGRYHYHGTPSAYLADLGVDGNEMVKVGYAADGFPIYYKYVMDDFGAIIALESGYQLKQGNRPGDGINAPNGVYDGLYFNDYEYVSQGAMLDECNGRWGKTPESEEEYYYVITDNFPSIPLCFSGTPSEDFQKRRGAGPSARPGGPGARRRMPPPRGGQRGG